MNTNTEKLKQEIFHLLTPKIAPVVEAVKIRYKLTNRRFVKRDFFRICLAERIDVMNTPVYEFMTGSQELLGCLVTMPQGNKAVYLKSFFEAELDLHTAAHELAHYFLKHQASAEDLVMLKTTGKYANLQPELEADLFAELLLK